MTAGSYEVVPGFAVVGYYATSPFPPIGSIDREPNEAHPLLVLASGDGAGAFFSGDVSAYLTANALWVDGVPWAAESVDYDADSDRTIATYPLDLTFVDGEDYFIEFKAATG